jgi:hypothetical protein
MREYIICSAIHIDNKKEYIHKPKNIKTGFVVCGRRHHDCFHTLFMIDSAVDKNIITQGFLTNTDKFLNRKESFQIARCANQIKNLGEWDQGSNLTSEDIY